MYFNLNIGNDIHVYTNCHFFRYRSSDFVDYFRRRSSGKPIATERSEWRNLFKDVSTALDMTGVNSYIKT